MVTLSSPPAFGFQTKNVNVGPCKYSFRDLDEDIRIDKVMKIAGYIPLIGMIIGWVRIWELSNTPKIKSKSPRMSNEVNHIVRGVMEVCCLGILLALIDLVVTAYRECRARYLSHAAELRHASFITGK